ncbi:hypothetical protein AB1L88_22730 [Tautonia sp. JC769]|uniref:hypothetical protein n=1 Tax=Tautonia sp. JC769 TaxID=3232135 RepID=UPI003459D044
MDINLIASLALAVSSLGIFGCGGSGPAPQRSGEPGREGPQAGIQEIPDSTRASLERSARETLQSLQDSPDEAPSGVDEGNLTLEAPITFSSIPAASLLEDGPGGAGRVEDLIDRSERRVIFPIRSGNRVVRSMLYRLEFMDDAPGAVGPPSVSNRADPFTLLVEEARRKQGRERPEVDYKGVSVFSLNQHFLYFNEGDREMMMPIATDPGMGFTAGEALPAAEVLERLREQLMTELSGEEAPG